MTREPDRYDKLREHPIFRYVPPEARETVADLLAAALRQAADDALERAAQDIESVDPRETVTREEAKIRIRLAKRLRAHASTSAHDAPPLLERCRHDDALDEVFGKSPAAAPAAGICGYSANGFGPCVLPHDHAGTHGGASEWAKQQGYAPPSAPVAPSLLPRVLAALETEANAYRHRSFPTLANQLEALAAELRRYIAGMEAPGQCGDRSDCDAAHKRIAELERLANDNAFSGMQHKARADAAEKRVGELEARR